MLFPLAWLGRFSPAYQRIFDALFTPDWVHVVMHLLLFVGLIILLALVFRPVLNSRRALALLCVVLLAGLFQELFQAWSSGVFYLPGVLFDLGVDLSGGLIGLALVFWIWQGNPVEKFTGTS